MHMYIEVGGSLYWWKPRFVNVVKAVGRRNVEPQSLEKYHSEMSLDTSLISLCYYFQGMSECTIAG